VETLIVYGGAVVDPRSVRALLSSDVVTGGDFRVVSMSKHDNVGSFVTLTASLTASQISLGSGSPSKKFSKAFS